MYRGFICPWPMTFLFSLICLIATQITRVLNYKPLLLAIGEYSIEQLPISMAASIKNTVLPP